MTRLVQTVVFSAHLCYPGSWILDVASQLPSAELYGIDIETRLFPESKPANVSFSGRSITDLPQEWDFKFNLVHQRLLYAALKRTEWTAAIRNMYRVLRPGGWVRLGESENVPVCAGSYTKQLYGFLKDLHSYYDLDISIHEQLQKRILDAGFRDVKVERRSFKLGQWAGEEGIANRNNLIGVYRGMKQRSIEEGVLNKLISEAEFDELLDNVQNEWDQIEGTEIVFKILIAMKPRGGSGR
jgi:predicted SAM-dependent methyltransferase